MRAGGIARAACVCLLLCVLGFASHVKNTQTTRRTTKCTEHKQTLLSSGDGARQAIAKIQGYSFENCSGVTDVKR